MGLKFNERTWIMQSIALNSFLAVAAADMAVCERAALGKDGLMPRSGALKRRVDYYCAHAVWSGRDSIMLTVGRNRGNIGTIPRYPFIALVSRPRGITLRARGGAVFEGPIGIDWELKGFCGLSGVDEMLNGASHVPGDILVFAWDSRAYRRVEYGYFALRDGVSTEVGFLDFSEDGVDERGFSFYKRVKDVAEVALYNGEHYSFVCSNLPELYNMLNFNIILERNRSEEITGYAIMNGERYDLHLYPTEHGLGYIDIYRGDQVYDNSVFSFVPREGAEGKI